MREVIAVEGVSKRFGEVEALKDLSFRIEGPRMVGILGPNGAGKTTLLDLLEGLSVPDQGEIRLFGEAITGPKRAPYPRSKIGVVLQKEFAMDEATTGEYAELFAAIYRVSGGRARILEAARLADRHKTPIARLSGGEAARLFLAAATVHAPPLLLLDEPTAALDPANKKALGRTLKAMSRERTVVITTHDLREAEALCDHLLFLVDGRVRAAGETSALIAAVPEEERRGEGVEDAFFHFCALRMRGGEVEARYADEPADASESEPGDEPEERA